MALSNNDLNHILRKIKSGAEDLDFHRIGIWAKDAKAIAAALPNSQVTKLDLQSNSIGDEGAKAIAGALPNTRVNELMLGDNLISDEGAKAIAAALPNSEVTRLFVANSVYSYDPALTEAILSSKTLIAVTGIDGVNPHVCANADRAEALANTIRKSEKVADNERKEILERLPAIRQIWVNKMDIPPEELTQTLTKLGVDSTGKSLKISSVEDLGTDMNRAGIEGGKHVETHAAPQTGVAPETKATGIGICGRAVKPAR